MTKFEQVGVSMQYEAPTKEIAQQKFSRSCECCYNRGMHIECDRCAIEIVHKLVMASFDDIERSKKNGRVEKRNTQVGK